MGCAHKEVGKAGSTAPVVITATAVSRACSASVKLVALTSCGTTAPAVAFVAAEAFVAAVAGVVLVASVAGSWSPFVAGPTGVDVSGGAR